MIWKRIYGIGRLTEKMDIEYNKTRECPTRLGPTCAEVVNKIREAHCLVNGSSKGFLFACGFDAWQISHDLWSLDWSCLVGNM